ncbi:DUF4129 domain-containing protein [Actinomadura sp. KC06]|uniref:DUF4129 domain-containing protein n=1 Tax=Actinomadura sp. KC06 TaxID=2530369 RepID=UPI001A9E4E2B|nr:DUF4129 domain-containing protein [Actinomadura sp. KC06]
MRTPTRRELGRAGAAALLLAAGAYGVRAYAGLWLDLYVHRPSTSSLIALAALEAIAVVLMVAALRRRRDGASEPVFGRWTGALATGFVLLVLGLPLGLAVLALRGPLHVELPPPDDLPMHEWPRQDLERESPWLVPPAAMAAVLTLAMIALIVSAAWVAVRYRNRRWRRLGGRRRPPAAPAGPPPSDRFEEAAEAGSRALRGTADARAAVIACYAVMEGVLAEAGAAPHASDTPAEVLARASGSGLAGLDAATTLTGLFREARYSDRPVTGRHRAEALAALESLRAGSRV